MSIVADIDGINVYLLPEMPVPGLLGASKPNERGGDILIDCALPLTEQRVTLLHELKHVIDGGHQAKLRASGSQHGGEGLCTAFAMNVLMPADWLRRDWLDGIRSLSALAERYQVPVEGLEHRLHGLGLLTKTTRQRRAQRVRCQWHPHDQGTTSIRRP
jgi:Zn-dependent peptidase ImmA (M78 family)